MDSTDIQEEVVDFGERIADISGPETASLEFAPERRPWPAAGDTALGMGDWTLNACMPTEWSSDRWYYYIEGYRRAADVLLHHVEEHRGDLDVLVFPFIFLWRQHIELELKRLIAYGRALAANSPRGSYPKHHRVAELWQEARNHVLREESRMLPECTAVDGVIAELSRIDPDSFEFRYPEDKNGNHTLKGIPYHLNLGRFQEALQNVSAFLRCSVYELSSRYDYFREAEAEARADYEREYGTDSSSRS